MDAEKLLSGKIFDTWKMEFPLLFRETNPNLSLTNNQTRACPVQRRAQFKLDGYFREINALKKFSMEISEMVRFLNHLVRENYSPAFLFSTEASWFLFLSLVDLFEETLEAQVGWIPAFWAWHVDPRKKQSGWDVHRDRPGTSLFDNGNPKSISCWIPLTDASPDNGCMHVIPKQYDKSYGVTPDKDAQIEGLQVIRALPGLPGDVFIWDQTLLHWGGRSSEFCKDPRLSLSLEIQRVDIPALEQNILPPKIPEEIDRMRLIGSQIQKFQHMYKLDDEALSLAKELTKL
tara:strand:+ start:3612 stop:4478 length:867 start_codon:yes stop_codon:yes gene_type:complete